MYQGPTLTHFNNATLAEMKIHEDLSLNDNSGPSQVSRLFRQASFFKLECSRQYFSKQNTEIASFNLFFLI